MLWFWFLFLKWRDRARVCPSKRALRTHLRHQNSILFNLSFMVERARYINKPDNILLAGNVLCMFLQWPMLLLFCHVIHFAWTTNILSATSFIRPTDPIHKLTFRPTDWKNIFWIWHSSLYISKWKLWRKKHETMLILLTPWTWQPSCFLCSFSFALASLFERWTFLISHNSIYETDTIDGDAFETINKK